MTVTIERGKKNYSLINVKNEMINWLVIIRIVVSIIAGTVAIYQMGFQKKKKEDYNDESELYN